MRPNTIHLVNPMSKHDVERFGNFLVKKTIGDYFAKLNSNSVNNKAIIHT
jgi:hypothetical protein